MEFNYTVVVILRANQSMEFIINIRRDCREPESIAAGYHQLHSAPRIELSMWNASQS